jgi:hypothetical protein
VRAALLIGLALAGCAALCRTPPAGQFEMPSE